STAEFRQHVAGDVAGVGRGSEKNVSRRDLFGLRRSAHRRRGAEILYLLVAALRRAQGRPDGAGRDAVDPDTALDQVLGERLGERVYRALGRRIVDQRLVAFESYHGAGIDDGGAGFHMGKRTLRHIEIAENVRPERLLPLLDGDLVQTCPVLLVSGVVDEHVQASQLAGDLFHRRLAKRRIPNVAGDEQGLAAFRLDFIGRALRVRLLAFEVDNRDIGALARV